MGRNQFGGNKQKSMANKNVIAPMRYTNDELELYAKVMKPWGNGMFQVQDNDGNLYMGHVRGKMRGKSKRNNLIKKDDIVMIGLREWESEKKNVDILFIYDESQVALIAERAKEDTSNIIEQNDMITYDYSSSSNNKDSETTESNVVMWSENNAEQGNMNGFDIGAI
jgi:initiation factor 1A